jgi:hypothetical protein
MTGLKPGQKPYDTTKVINLWAGPGAGKSTLAAGLFFMMKTKGYKVELVTEFAKELVYAERWTALNDQEYVTNFQNERLERLVGKVDYIITDSPLPLAEIYVTGEDTYRKHCTEHAWDLFSRYDNVNIFVNRVKPYAEYGRTQNEADARIIDEKLRDLTAGMIDDVVNGNTNGVLDAMNFIETLKD